ncbi:MAG: molybdopterin-guanine dinucleotide biosynthesis protein [Thermoleophilia bacterium]|nr:molybdopterin-guanine dinucleotide biosynthesis protein [Thermoleophilia bacterium]
MHEWLQEAAERLARETGADPSGLQLTEEQIDGLLELARIAAHESGERTNAPLVSYLVGLALGRQGGDLGDAIDAVVGKRV